MKSELHILHLEDNATDAELIQSLLSRASLACRMDRVQTREGFTAALEQGGYDLVFSDFTLPAFDGLSALGLAREKCPEIPFLFVSGTLGEEVAIDTLQAGATDYVLKQRLSRLVPAVRRALAEAEERRARQRAEESMIQSEFKYRHLFECLAEAALLLDADRGRILDANHQAEVLLGCERGKIIGQNLLRFHVTTTLEEFWRASGNGGAARFDFRGQVVASDGRIIPVAVSASPLSLYHRPLILGLYRDITGQNEAELGIHKLNEELRHRVRERTGDLDAACRNLELHREFLDHPLRERLLLLDACARQLQSRASVSASSTVASSRSIHQSIAQLLHTIDRFLLFISAGQKPLKASRLDMTVLAQAAWESIHPPFPGITSGLNYLNCPRP